MPARAASWDVRANARPTLSVCCATLPRAAIRLLLPTRIAAWCCLRASIRHFRADRIARIALTAQPYGKPRRTLTKEWQQAWEQV
ncbi:WYL domain-containing protein [Sorangium sp. So ce341]|uniref:WYL domain-containing protein n=1 Tax=Sorangium sp. So ce341 TaxID=3133302 RepID=UPI003F6225DC